MTEHTIVPLVVPERGVTVDRLGQLRPYLEAKIPVDAAITALTRRDGHLCAVVAMPEQLALIPAA